MTPRLRRLNNEYTQLRTLVSAREQIEMQVLAEEGGIPTRYLIIYNIRAMCGVTDIEHLNEEGAVCKPVYADRFLMTIDIPPSYPCIDAMPQFNFLVHDESHRPIAHPWHPNIRYFGAFAGYVCMNFPDSYASLAWAVDRIRQYLNYSLYHAKNEPPYPEDLKVAQWFLNNGY
ncbi:MAG: hypothetical protein HUK08_01470 [Bacteroidaceae bacterium]|nr:hypothetical protein [Bacteroidaceae bacterium]